MNKTKCSILILVLCFFLTFAVYSLRTFADVGMTQEQSPSYGLSKLDIKPVNGIVNLEAESVDITVTSEFTTIKTPGGTIPNVKSGNLIVENGNPVSGKLFFSADSSFDLNGQHISVPKDGSIEFKDGKLIVSKGTSVEVGGVDEVGGTKLTAMTDGTGIKIQGDIIEANGHISIDYENSPNKIILTGKDSVLELQTELKTGEKEKFEFSDGKELIINIGLFHDGKSEECKGKNCISYQDMGTGKSGEEWNKIKIDGNAIITKYFNEEKIYEINFENGKAKISRDLSKLKDTEFSEKTVINYNSGDITLFIETSEKRAEEINIGRINVGNGIIDAEFYNDINVQIANEPPPVKPPEIPKTTETQGTEGGTENSGTSGTVKTDATKNAETFMINSNGEYKSVAETVRSILEELNYDTMTDDDIFAAIQQETAFKPRPGDSGDSIGLVQVSSGAFRDAINLWKKLGAEGNKKYQQLYDTYEGYSDEALKSALADSNLNLEVSISYFKSIEENNGFSEENLESKYGYTGDQKDILLLAYNGGPAVTKKILESANLGENWKFYKLEEFLWDENQMASKEATEIFETFDVYKDANIDMKVWYMINHVRQVRTYAGSSDYKPYVKPDWLIEMEKAQSK